MADINSVLGEFMGQPIAGPSSDKYAQVSAKAQEKKARLSGYTDGAGIEVGLADPALTSNDILKPAGEAESFGYVAGRDQYINDTSGSRTNSQVTGDSVVDIINGAAQGVLGIGGAVAGAVSDRGGAAISGFANDANDFASGLQSDALTGRRQAYAARNEITTAHNEALYQDETITDGPLMAGLRRVGRDVISGVTNNDTATLGSGISQGVGSMLVGGYAGKALKALRLGEASMPVAIGALEGGGAYNQTVSEVMGLSHEQLMHNSPDYAALIQAGEDPTTAKEHIANKAGLLAGGIQAPIGALTGKLVSKFEANPLKITSAGGFVHNILSETVEEGLQSGAGQAVSNLGIKTYADQNRDLLQDVGRSAGEGALYGAGTAGAVQGPTLPFSLAADVGRGVVGASKAAFAAASDRTSKIIGKIDQTSPLHPENIRTQMDELKTAITNPSFVEDMKAVFAKNSEPAQAAAAVDYVQRVAERMIMDPTVEAESESSPIVKDLVANSSDRFDALSRASNIVTDEASSEQDKLDAGIYILEQVRKNSDLFDSDLRGAVEQVDDNDPVLGQLRKMEQVLNNIHSNPVITDSLKKAMEVADAITPETMDDNLTQVESAAKMAELVPENAKPEVLQRIQFHDDNGTVTLPADLRKAVDAAVALNESKDVSENIISKDDGQYISGQTHLNNIVSAIKAGNKPKAAQSLQALMQFAEHQQNKVKALNDNLVSGNGTEAQGTKYQSLLAGKGVFIPSAKGMWINPQVPSSISLAQKVGRDTDAIVQLANNLATIYGDELGVKPLETVSLDPNIQGDVREVARKYRGTQSAPASEPAGKQTSDESVSTEVEAEPKPADSVTEPSPAPAGEVSPLETEAAVKSEPVVEAAPAKQTLQTIYSRLHEVTGKVTNYFLKSFKLAEGVSRLTGDPQPLRTVLQALKNDTAWKAIATNAKGTLTSDLASAYQRLIREYGLILNNELVKRVNENAINNPKFKEFFEPSKDGRKPNTYVNGKILNLLEQKEDGSWSYNDQLLKEALLAGIQWALVADQRSSRKDEKAISKILGIPEVDVQDVHLNFFNKGIPVVNAKNELASLIRQFWGVSPQSDGLSGYTDGIPEAMAAEMLHALEEAKLFTQAKETFAGRSHIQLVMNENEDLRTLDALPNAIEQLVLAEPSDVFFIGSAPTSQPKTQMRNKQARLSRQQEELVANAQKVAHSINMPVLNLYNSFGDSGLVELFGGGKFDPETTNKNDAARMDGQNLTVMGALKTLGRLMERVQNDGSLEAAKIFYEYQISKVGRLHMQGANNPQANKVMREVVLSTIATVDMTKPETQNLFKLAMGQHWGMKVETQLHDVTGEKVDDLAAGALAPAIEMLQEWDGKNRSLSDKDVTFLKDTFAEAGVPMNPASLHAALEYARYANAIGNGTDKAFKTSTYIEADGKTDGPINAMLHMASGMFTPAWISVMEKGGYFLGQRSLTQEGEPMSLNRYVSMKTADGSGVDLYGKAGTAASAAYMASYAGADPVTKTQLSHLATLMDELGVGLKIVGENKVELTRSLLKNPVTITIYGSGDRGIAGNIVKEMQTAIYERITKGEPLTDASREALKALTETEVATSKNGDVYLRKPDVKLPKEATRKGYSFTVGKDSQTSVMTNNVLKLLVRGPLMTGIKETIGETDSNVSMLQKAVQIQSIFVARAFNAAVQAKLESKESPSDGLTGKEIQEIWAQVKHLSPLIDTGLQTYTTAASGKADLRDTAKVEAIRARNNAKLAEARINGDEAPELERLPDPIDFGRSLTDGFRTAGGIEAPMNAGVRGIPMMIIGPGDGMMMQIFGTDQTRPDTLMVFDGINMSLNDIEAGSQLANRAVHKGWMTTNPLAEVSQTYNDFLQEVDTSEMSAEMQQELVDSIMGPGSQIEGNSADVIKNYMAELGDEIRKASIVVQARKNVLVKVRSTTDHMATAMSPHVNEGKVDLRGTTPSEMAAHLNEMLTEELDRMGKETKDRRLLPVSQKIAPELAALGALNKTSGARTASMTELRRAVRSMNVPSEQKVMLEQTLRVLADTDYQITFGSMEQLQADREANGLSPLDFSGASSLENIKGFNLPNEQRVYLINPSSEILLHELIHAATIDRVQAFYNDPSSLTAEQRDAASRIDAMMHEWTDERQEFEDPATQRAYDSMQTNVMGATFSGDMAGAANEFMAWVLSNQNLTKAARKVAVPRLAQIAKDVLAAIKQLVWGKAKGPDVGSDLYSNLKFNTLVLMQLAPSTQQMIAQSIQYHDDNSTSVNTRLREVRVGMARKVGMFVRSQPKTGREQMKNRFTLALANAFDTAKSFRDHGWDMTPEEDSTFQMIVAGMATEMELDANAQARAQQIYASVTESLTEEQFMVDPQANDFQDRMQAQEKLSTLLGVYTNQKDIKRRSSLLSSFIGLAAVNEDFRAILEKIKIPKDEINKEGTANAALENFGNKWMNALLKFASGEGRSANVQEAIDALTDRIVENLHTEQNIAQRGWTEAGNKIDQLNDKVVEGMNWANDKVFDVADNISSTTNNQTVKKLAEFTKGLTAIIGEKQSEIVANGITASFNNNPAIPRALTEVWTEVLGRTKSNAVIYDMIKRVRSYVQQTRQQFREHQPKVIKKAFTRELTKDEWSHLTKGLGQMDIASLAQSFAVKDILKMLASPSQVSSLIMKLENDIQGMDIQNWTLRQRKAKELAAFMNGGKPSANLLRNATAVANLFEEIPALIRAKMASPSPDMISKLDQLISLYAYTGLDANIKETVSKLVVDEPEGMNYSLSMLVGQRKDEMVKAKNGLKAEHNHYKGHVPLENDGGGSLIVASDVDSTRLKLQGYTRVADYEGSPAERVTDSRGYYYTKVPTRAAFKQGIIQNVRQTAFGVDPYTGYTIDATTAGVISNPREVQSIQRLQRLNSRGNEPLLPVFDGQGNVVAYERSISSQQQARLKLNTNLAEVLGIWRGRIAEEHYAGDFNRKLIENLAQHWKDGKKAGESSQYIDLFSKEVQKDLVIRDAVKLFTPESRAMIDEAFPDGTFMVRRDLVNDAIGYRSASLGDAWTNVTRLNPEVQKVIKDVSISLFGKNAFEKITHYEKLFQTVVSDAKVTIVVKSVIVPLANIASNIVHLSTVGVPLKDILKGFSHKTAEVDSFFKGRIRRIQLESDLRVAEGNGNNAKAQQIKAQLQSIFDVNRSLSIWPLVEAGELAAISDTGISHEDTLLAEGKISEYLEQVTEKLPAGLKTAAKYGMVSRDTALFKGLQKSVEYGDFLAKGVLFDDLVKRKGKTPEEALARITEEFVNYDRQPGRGRGYLEDMGLLWFWNYKLRSIKIAISTLRHNPVHAMLTSLLPLPHSIGSALGDNALSVIAGGNMNFSIGIDQLATAHAMNPWANLAGISPGF